MDRDTRIRRLRKAMKCLSTGEFPVDIQIDGDDEVAQLGRALSELAGSVERSYREVQLLTSITHKVNAGVLLNEVLNHVYGSFREVIPYDRIGFALLMDEGRQVVSHWARSETATMGIDVGYQAPLVGSSLQTILETGRPRILNDLKAYLAEHPESQSTKLILDAGVRSSLTCPLIAMGKPIGFLFFSSGQPGTYQNLHSEVFLQIAGQLAVIVEKSRLYEEVLREREKADRLLLNILPAPVAERLKTTDDLIAQAFDSATVLFADLVDFTPWSADQPADVIVRLLNQIFMDFDVLTEKHGVEKIKTIGDAYMVASGLPTKRPDHVEAMLRLAVDMLDTIRKHRKPDGSPIRVRIGVHTGPVVAGVIGKKKFIYDLWGDTVNVASRMESHGVPDRIHVTAQVRDAVATHYQFEERGPVTLKGRGAMKTFLLICKE